MDLKEQNEKKEGLVNYLEDEKSRLQDKVEQMLTDGRLQPLVAGRRPCRRSSLLKLTSLSSASKEKDLVLELECMREKYGVCRRERSPSRLDAFVKSLEEERDFYRQEAERYKRGFGFGDQDLSFCRNPQRGRSPRTKASDCTPDIQKNFNLSKLYFMQGLATFLFSLQGGLLEEELIHVVRERDELKDALLDIERRMRDIQDNAKILSAERDKFITLFKQVRLECIVSPSRLLFDASDS